MKRGQLLIIFLFYTILPPESQAQQADDPLWFKKSIIYNLDVHTYKDSDGDGKGDFKGLAQQLDYIRSLGVDVIWLAPFQPSPKEDDGYDISDYYTIDSSCGNFSDFAAFLQQAQQRDIKVIMDMVLNHSSNKHPWFVESATDSTSRYRKWYSWTKERPSNYNKGMAFPGVQQEIWSYTPSAKAYYYHRFYRFEPDLNFQNPEVRAESKKIISFWLQKGLKGFRLDAVPFMLEKAIPGEDKPPQDFKMLYDFHKSVKDAVLLGEANVAPEENIKYFGKNGQGLHMMFNFYVNQYLFYALATGKTSLLKKALLETKTHPANTQFVHFLRNHDEIDLGRLTKEQREEVSKVMGPEKDMQLYDRGIRRRLAPMLSNDPAHLAMAYSFLMALPGTPVIRSGDEIGMGDDLHLKERLSVRTPMQWSATENAGFTSAKKTFRPVISKGEYGYKKVNVAHQDTTANSLLNEVRKLAQLRRSHPETGTGKWQLLDAGDSSIVAIQYENKLITLHNFSPKPSHAVINLNNAGSIADPELKHAAGRYEIELKGYGYKWVAIDK
ncbi:alpha-amylase family protein [Filimonas effusa]|uniref:Trehalose synthase n=1 Tax=Filimonas effusa TaxID=2508721 RepID=A0A4Q1D8T8_9BACT|nr:alpha-amylase family protein [Filimonas effusa]RXK85762.1 trehalose synthase [Filimonas effusa]